MNEVGMRTKRTFRTSKNGLPAEAFAVVGDPTDVTTWRWPHHKKSIRQVRKGSIDIEETVDWAMVSAAVSSLLPGKNRAPGGDVSPEDILKAAGHLADHYRKAARPLPDILAALL
jgi:hypothetical protein